MSNLPTILTDGIGNALAASTCQARTRVTLAVPFIKRAALERLLAGLPEAVELTIVTRWRVDEVAAGVSDLSVLDFVTGRVRSRLLLHPRLHAKVLLVDDLSVVGSANVTDSALGFADYPNAEAVAVLRPPPNRLSLFLAQLESESVVATDELRRRFEEAVKICPPPWHSPGIELAGEPMPYSTPPFPRFRIPERLYSGYLSVFAFSDADLRMSILHDLVALNLPDGLDEAGFRLRVGAALLAFPDVAAFDNYVALPRYFGDMAEWMRAREVTPDQGPEERKRYLQTLIRWLLYFVPGRYRLDEPNYSERFGQIAGWS